MAVVVVAAIVVVAVVVGGTQPGVAQPAPQLVCSLSTQLHVVRGGPTIGGRKVEGGRRGWTATSNADRPAPPPREASVLRRRRLGLGGGYDLSASVARTKGTAR